MSEFVRTTLKTEKTFKKYSCSCLHRANALIGCTDREGNCVPCGTSWLFSKQFHTPNLNGEPKRKIVTRNIDWRTSGWLPGVYLCAESPLRRRHTHSGITNARKHATRARARLRRKIARRQSFRTIKNRFIMHRTHSGLLNNLNCEHFSALYCCANLIFALRYENTARKMQNIQMSTQMRSLIDDFDEWCSAHRSVQRVCVRRCNYSMTEIP